MRIGLHPVADNPIRMGYVPGWASVASLLERLGDLEHAVGKDRVVPAPWEPYSYECLSSRYAEAYALARCQLENPVGLGTALAFFAGDEERDLPSTEINHANRLILRAKNEPSYVTRKLMLSEALELWRKHATNFLPEVVRTCERLGVTVPLTRLGQQVEALLKPLDKNELLEEGLSAAESGARSRSGHGFDKDLLHMDGWTPDPGMVILPVDGKMYSLAREILLMDLQNVVLLKARKCARCVPWEKATLVHVFDGAVIFEVDGEAPLIVAGYRSPEEILKQVQACYKAATERILQALAAKVTRKRP